MIAPEPGPNRMNMKFTNGGRTVVIHLVRGLPPKLSKDKKNHHHHLCRARSDPQQASPGLRVDPIGPAGNATLRTDH